jgi:hypothetical protein
MRGVRDRLPVYMDSSILGIISQRTIKRKHKSNLTTAIPTGWGRGEGGGMGEEDREVRIKNYFI